MVKNETSNLQSMIMTAFLVQNHIALHQNNKRDDQQLKGIPSSEIRQRVITEEESSGTIFSRSLEKELTKTAVKKIKTGPKRKTKI